MRRSSLPAFLKKFLSWSKRSILFVGLPLQKRLQPRDSGGGGCSRGQSRGLAQAPRCAGRGWKCPHLFEAFSTVWLWVRSARVAPDVRPGLDSRTAPPPPGSCSRLPRGRPVPAAQGTTAPFACPATRGRLAGAGRGARGRPVWLLVFGPPVQDSPAHSEGALPRGAWGRRVLTGTGLLPGRGQRPPPRLTLRCPVLPVTHPHVGERVLAPAEGSRRGAVSCFSHLFSSLVVIEQRRWAVTNSPACTRVCRHGRFVSPHLWELVRVAASRCPGRLELMAKALGQMAVTSWYYRHPVTLTQDPSSSALQQGGRPVPRAWVEAGLPASPGR